MHVAVVTETYPPEIGGAAMCLGRFVECLVARGHQVDLTRPRQVSDEGTSDEGGARLVRGLPVPLHPGLQFGLPAGRRLAEAWRKKKPDVVHVASEGLLGRSAIRAAQELGVPVCTSFHTNFHRYGAYYGLGFLSRMALRYLRAFHRKAVLTMVPTARVHDELASQGFANLAVVSRGVDRGLFHPGRRSDALRVSWGAGPDDLVAAYVGRLAPEKNIDLALTAYEAMRAARPGTRMVAVGDGPLRPALEKRHPGVCFVGYRRGEELAAHYASADIFLFPSLTETFGNVAMEAMASGLCVVAFDDGAVQEHVRNGTNGLVAHMPEEFVAQAVRAAVEPGLARGIGAHAAGSVAALGWDRIGQAYEEALCRVVESARRPESRQ